MSGTDTFSAFFWHRSQDPESLFCRRCPGPTPYPALLPPSASLQCSACRPPPLSFPQPLKATEGLFLETLISPPLPIFPTPYRPRPRGLQGGRRGAQGWSPRLRFGESLPPPPLRNNPAPLSGTRTVGCGWGGVRSWGKVSAFKEGGRPAPGTSPCPESFPSGAMECARGGRGGREGVGWGWTESQPDPPPPRRGQCGGREGQAARSGQEGAPPPPTQGCHESLTLQTAHPQPTAYSPSTRRPLNPK